MYKIRSHLHKNEIYQMKFNFLDDSVIYIACYLAFTDIVISL